MTQPYGPQTIPPVQHPAPRPPAPQHQAPPPAPRGTEPVAVAALVAGVLGFVVPLVGLLAIVLGGIGVDRTRRRGTGGRGMARTGIVLGSIQVVLTALLVVAGLLFWNAYGDDIERGLEQAGDLTQQELSLPDLVLGGLTGDYSFEDLRDLAGAAGQMDELRELADQCQAGDPASCDELLENVPQDLVPEELRGSMP